jgi:tRNA pseudouridine32 synthase/23S rRNA pseudouridine746 synthase
MTPKKPETISRSLSKVTMPEAEKPYPSVLGFLTSRFPRVARCTWEKRIQDGKVLDDQGTLLTPDTPYLPGKRIFYSREVENERAIPFVEEIIFQDDELLVACKPHFLPVIPSGPYVAECLLSRLRQRTGNHDLVPIHRIDRETAGIVMFSANRKTRDMYSQLFRQGRIEKSYEALAACAVFPEQSEWIVKNRIVTGEPWFRMKAVPGEANARSIIRVLEVNEGKGFFQLTPLTGKTHQLRLHMSGLGFKILNDKYYPELLPQTEDDFNNPLQLLAKSVRFLDPVTGQNREFATKRTLLW